MPDVRIKPSGRARLVPGVRNSGRENGGLTPAKRCAEPSDERCRFAETVFGIPPMTGRDAASEDMTNAFDWKQAPRPFSEFYR